MARVYGGIVKTAVQAEQLAPADRPALIAILADGALLDGLKTWAIDAANWTKDEAGWRQAFPQLAALSDKQTRALMRVIADQTDGIFVP